MNQNEINEAVSTPIGVLRFLPETKAQVKTFAELIRMGVINGDLNALEVMSRIKAVESTAKEILAQKEIQEEARKEAEKYGERSFERGNFTIQLAENGTTYDYSVCNDATYNRLKEEADRINKALKERCEFLKMVTQPMTFVDDETGEISQVKPPLKSSTSGLKFTMK